MLTGAQIRGARGMLNWSASDLAARSGVSVPTIRRLEKESGSTANAYERTLIDLKRAFEEAGVEFIGTPEDCPGVRLKTGKPD